MALFPVSELYDRIKELVDDGEKLVEIEILDMDPDPEYGHSNPYKSISFTTYDEYGDGVESEPVDSVE